MRKSKKSENKGVAAPSAKSLEDILDVSVRAKVWVTSNGKVSRVVTPTEHDSYLIMSLDVKVIAGRMIRGVETIASHIEARVSFVDDIHGIHKGDTLYFITIKDDKGRYRHWQFSVGDVEGFSSVVNSYRKKYDTLVSNLSSRENPYSRLAAFRQEFLHSVAAFMSADKTAGSLKADKEKLPKEVSNYNYLMLGLNSTLSNLEQFKDRNGIISLKNGDIASMMQSEKCHQGYVDIPGFTDVLVSQQALVLGANNPQSPFSLLNYLGRTVQLKLSRIDGYHGVSFVSPIPPQFNVICQYQHDWAAVLDSTNDINEVSRMQKEFRSISDYLKFASAYSRGAQREFQALLERASDRFLTLAAKNNSYFVEVCLAEAQLMLSRIPKKEQRYVAGKGLTQNVRRFLKLEYSLDPAKFSDLVEPAKGVVALLSIQDNFKLSPSGAYIWVILNPVMYSQQFFTDLATKFVLEPQFENLLFMVPAPLHVKGLTEVRSADKTIVYKINCII